MLHTRERERGAAATELALAMPVVLILIMVVVQGALYYHAANVVTAAAQDGLRAAQVADGSPGAGDRRARAVLGSAGGLLDDLDVTVSPDARRVRVQVSGSVPSLVPGLDAISVTRSAEGPREQFLPPDQR